MSAPIHRRMLAAAGIVVALLGVAGPASAAPPLDHEGTYGNHWQLSSDEFPGASCIYDQQHHLRRIKVRQPIIFAADRTGNVDSQQVGWQILLVPVDFTAGVPAVHTSSLVTTTATDRDPAHFTDRIVDKPFSFWNDHEGYGVMIRSRWFRPAGTQKGRTVDMVQRTRLVIPGDDVVGNYCPAIASVPLTSGLIPVSHTGTYAPHFLLDSQEIPAVTCKRDGGGSLSVIKARRPILFANDRGAGVQSQKVRWRIVVTPVPFVAGGSAATDVYAGPWHTATATESRFADFQPVSVAKPQSFWDDHQAYLVRYEFLWLHPGTTLEGRVLHNATYYQDGAFVVTDQCSYTPPVVCAAARPQAGARTSDRGRRSPTAC